MKQFRPAVVQLRGVTKTYRMGKDNVVNALQGVDLDIHEGEFVAIMGPSGSGKSTLMNVVGCLDVSDTGEYILAGENVGKLSDDQLAAIRNKHVGFVFQTFNLLPRLNAIENVELPLIYGGDRKGRRERAIGALEAVGLGDRVHHRPAELSGGQQQRVAIARALLNDPAMILADEPTGNLDSKASAEILEFMRQAVTDLGQTIVMVTHDPIAAGYSDRVVFLADGKIVDELQSPTAETVIDHVKDIGE